MIKQDRGAWFNVTSAGTASATATQSATAGQLFYVTDIAGISTGSAGTISVLGGSAGATVIWQVPLANNVPFAESFVTPLAGIPGQGVSVKVQGTTTTTANISGFIVNTA